MVAVNNQCYSFSSYRREINEILAWASAQVVCICSINPQKVVDCVNTTLNTTTSSVNVFRSSTSLSPSK